MVDAREHLFLLRSLVRSSPAFKAIIHSAKTESNQANSYSISIHMSFLLSQHLVRLSLSLSLYCCLSFRCDADISL